MNATVAALWLRALRAVDARGLLPANRSRFTPGELAAEAALRGEDRLARLVDGWYYPTSYGRVRGVLSDDEVDGLIVALEAAMGLAATTPAPVAPVIVEKPRPPRFPSCDLCGAPLPPSP